MGKKGGKRTHGRREGIEEERGHMGGERHMGGEKHMGGEGTYGRN